ncbi:hypothetical protein ANCCAN_16965 [Ancylostoma caninum]|uniref:Uncharacterized protein n=1 Tax=Ancylostoma caninum TaxID=29170 RepID=A0A368FY66_ANCCA|nr:hypothetical protein ANCCAN_16965 [Ancylostoma caninum]
MVSTMDEPVPTVQTPEESTDQDDQIQKLKAENRLAASEGDANGEDSTMGVDDKENGDSTSSPAVNAPTTSEDVSAGGLFVFLRYPLLFPPASEL